MRWTDARLELDGQAVVRFFVKHAKKLFFESIEEVWDRNKF